MGALGVDHRKEGEKLETPERTVFICEEPLTIQHLYTEPYEQTITRDWGAWALVGQNKRKGTVRLENKTFKKTTLGDLDTELDWLRQCLQIAQDKNSFPDQKPCISVHQYEVWSRKANEIGKMIGGYYNSLNPQKTKKK